MYKLLNSEKVVTLKEIVDNYEANYHGRTIKLITNFKKLKEPIVNFDVLDVPHLLGLQYLSEKHTAAQFINLIKDERLVMADLKKDKLFSERIKDRIKHYDFINEVFKRESSQLMVVTKDIQPSRLGPVEFLIYDYINENRNKMVLLGFSPTSKKYYVPATLHVRRAPNVFTERRITNIKSMEWVR
ncbi:PBECR4 domain-containing protein [Fructobacillus ficulneus]|uniref:Phage-Barnase-EndoU-ColicinE5/D-RelE like nuclease 4 domain-containing protein n=1 Tax=Fructobacillus ficulneus TaxID=157463 RepID=A0A0K8MI59_9LACO|nr:PBECR4 domain-containing protein [Fructobacillus ficulneus]GAP00138.1 hypothetical protein FFIC_281450 [Fructobacillus ficulneus]